MEGNADWLLFDLLMEEMRRLTGNRQQQRQELRRAIAQQCRLLLMQASWIPSISPEVLLQLLSSTKTCVPVSKCWWEQVHAHESLSRVFRDVSAIQPFISNAHLSAETVRAPVYSHSVHACVGNCLNSNEMGIVSGKAWCMACPRISTRYKHSFIVKPTFRTLTTLISDAARLSERGEHAGAQEPLVATSTVATHFSPIQEHARFSTQPRLTSWKLCTCFLIAWSGGAQFWIGCLAAG
jgi:hypothetical protein